MENTSLIILKQERHIRLKDIIKKYQNSGKAILIYSPYSTKLMRVKFLDIFIAPDTPGLNYEAIVNKYIQQQKNIYFPIYQKLLLALQSLLPKNKRIKLESIHIN